jgi:thiosulfate reductase cytochrome b subunit
MEERGILYSTHERIWHWLQAGILLLLLLTGFAIHDPARFGIFGSLARAVSWHSWLGIFLVVNAFLGLFYHVTAEKYRHFLPRMDDFTEGAIRQVRYYLYGIFKGEPHPYETSAARKLNPLQKLTYLVLLNILLPYQIVTGVLMWGANRWPDLFEAAGRLRVLGPAHTLGAFLFAAFLVTHIYLTTTGKTPFSLMRAMITGCESPGGRPASHVRQEPEEPEEPAEAEGTPRPAAPPSA